MATLDDMKSNQSTGGPMMDPPDPHDDWPLAEGDRGEYAPILPPVEATVIAFMADDRSSSGTTVWDSAGNAWKVTLRQGVTFADVRGVFEVIDSIPALALEYGMTVGGFPVRAVEHTEPPPGGNYDDWGTEAIPVRAGAPNPAKGNPPTTARSGGRPAAKVDQLPNKATVQAGDMFTFTKGVTLVPATTQGGDPKVKIIPKGAQFEVAAPTVKVLVKFLQEKYGLDYTPKLTPPALPTAGKEVDWIITIVGSEATNTKGNHYLDLSDVVIPALGAKR